MSIGAVPVRSVRQTGDGELVAACGEGGRGGTQPASVTSSNIDSSDCFIEAPLAPGRPGCPLLLPPTCLAAAGHRPDQRDQERYAPSSVEALSRNCRSHCRSEEHTS